MGRNAARCSCSVASLKHTTPLTQTNPRTSVFCKRVFLPKLVMLKHVYSGKAETQIGLRGRIPVTLCIAAACQEEGKPRVVVCSDWKSSSSLGSSQTSDKLRWLKRKPTWLALTAGKERAIESLVRRYRKELESEGDITDSNAEEIFERIAKRHLQKVKSDCVERELGVSYDYFRTHLDEFPPQIQIGMFNRVSRTDLGVSLLVLGFVKVGRKSQQPLICKVGSDGSTSICPHFGAIGEGWLVATPSLLRREFSSNVSLKKAIYQLYESKTLAETVPSVGDDTSVDVFYPNGTLRSITKSGYSYLDKMLKVYGPKHRVTRMEGFRDRFLEGLPFSGIS
jgi:hypothetical protein